MTNPTIYSDQVQFENPQKLRWQDSSLCAQVDPEVFFPSKGGTYTEARKICGRCLVRSNCLEKIMEDEGDAERADRYGMVAGLTPTERHNLYLERKAHGQPDEECEDLAA